MVRFQNNITGLSDVLGANPDFIGARADTGHSMGAMAKCQESAHHSELNRRAMHALSFVDVVEFGAPVYGDVLAVGLIRTGSMEWQVSNIPHRLAGQLVEISKEIS